VPDRLRQRQPVEPLDLGRHLARNSQGWPDAMFWLKIYEHMV
jgi:hypothetical protein